MSLPIRPSLLLQALLHKPVELGHPGGLVAEKLASARNVAILGVLCQGDVNCVCNVLISNPTDQE